MQTVYRVKRTSLRPLHRLFVVMAGSAFVAVMIAFSLAQRGRTQTAEPAIPHGVALAQWSNNGHNGQYVLQILDGASPGAEGSVSGVVISDTHCTPDARGLSHCHNVIELGNGSLITVINTHLMKRYHCLKPGESVELSPINNSWIKAELL